MREALTAIALLAAIMVASTSPVFAQEPPSSSGGGSCGEGSDTTRPAAETLRKTFFNYQFQEVKDTPVAGIFEVRSGQNILYWAPLTGHLIFGELWDKNGQNLTAKSREARVSKLISALPLDKAVKVGNGPKQVIEFSNPDCGHCRRTSEFFAARQDVTRFIFLLDSGKEKTAAKVRHILAATNKAAAYEEVMAGKLDAKQVSGKSKAAIRLQEDHQRIASLAGIKGTPQFWIDGTHVSGANIKAIESLLR